MFEHREELVRELLEKDDEFYVLYQRHRALNAEVDAIEESGVWDDLKLRQLKKEKLRLRDKLELKLQKEALTDEQQVL
jgi:uncharacterized protein YdcH (DUF465 family)